MKAYLLDTNIVIQHLREGFFKKMPLEIEFTISVITEAELFRLSGLSEQDIHVMNQFLSLCKSVSVDSRIARRAAILGRTRKTKLPDLLIAATALEHGLTLVTKNLRDFRGLPGLKVKSSI